MSRALISARRNFVVAAGFTVVPGDDVQLAISCDFPDLSVTYNSYPRARSLGVATGPLRIAIVAAATLTTSASVATAGIIGWVGLVVPHLARSLVGPDFARLLPTAAILGGGYLLVIDTLARTAAEVEIPLGILTAVVGTPFFIWLLASMQRTWS